MNARSWIAGILLLGLPSAVSAQSQLEVSWGSAVVPQKLIYQDGAGLDTIPLIMEVGTFGSFVPTAGNIIEWAANWRVFDGITTPDSDPNGSDFLSIDSGDNTQARFAGSAHLLGDQTSNSEDAAISNPTATFGPSEQGYVFFRTSDNLSESPQWLLYTSAVDSDGAGIGDSVWQFPSVGGGQPDFPLNWWLDQADTAIVGAINGGGGYGGSTGGGDHTDVSTDFGVRLHTVPEPSGALLLLLGVIVFTFRRR